MSAGKASSLGQKATAARAPDREGGRAGGGVQTKGRVPVCIPRANRSHTVASGKEDVRNYRVA
jgi:hypothetical protein